MILPMSQIWELRHWKTKAQDVWLVKCQSQDLLQLQNLFTTSLPLPDLLDRPEMHLCPDPKLTSWCRSSQELVTGSLKHSDKRSTCLGSRLPCLCRSWVKVGSVHQQVALPRALRTACRDVPQINLLPRVMFSSHILLINSRVHGSGWLFVSMCI